MLGYIGYFGICAFSYLQIAFMIQGRTRNLGRLPLFSLVMGLSVLQLSLYGDRAVVPTYVQVGNAASLLGSIVTLALTYRPQPSAREQYLEIAAAVDTRARTPRIVDQHGELS